MRISNLIILMLFSVSGYSQPSEDIRQITQLMVDDYAVDSIKVYYKYDNSGLANDLEEAKLLVDMETMKELDLTNDSISIDVQLSMFDENVILLFEGIEVKYYEAEKLLENNNKKNLKRYSKGKFIKQRKKRPLAFISSPIISKNGMHAIVYSSYVCGGLCGSGSVQFFKKLNNEWIIDKYKIRWIS